MEPNELLAAWENGVPLGDAWLAFADIENTKRYRKARREGSHSAIRISLEIDLIARLEDGELQAIGIEGGSDPKPALIPEYYFTKTAEISLDADTVAAFGKKFHEVRVQGPREVVDEPWMDYPNQIRIVDPQEVASAAEALRLVPEPSDNPPVQREPQSLDDARRRGHEKPEEVHSSSKVRGRPSKALEIERATEILLGRGVDLAKMSRPKAYDAVRKCAAGELKADTKIGFADPVIQRAVQALRAAALI
jgi:hypothetical protein